MPELFHAFSLRKVILCCLLRDSKFDGLHLGDSSNPRRFKLLLSDSCEFHPPDSLLERLRTLREKLSQDQPPGLFDLTENFLSWQRNRTKYIGSIEDLLNDYASAWESGFRPARSFLTSSLVAPSGTSLAKLSGWIDDDHIGLFWKSSHSESSVTLLNTKTGGRITATLPAGIEPLGMGTSETRELIVSSHGSNGIVFRRWHDGKWEAFPAEISPAVFTGVIHDRWFAGSGLFRLDWENRCLKPETPAASDWELFRRFAWFDPPSNELPSQAPPSVLLFATQPEHWTLLPSPWRSLQGDADVNRSRLVVWNKSQILFGDLESASSFGATLPRVVQTKIKPQPPTGNGEAPKYLHFLCGEIGATPPGITPSRVETEDSLSLSWTASHRHLQSHFIWSLNLEEARQFLNDLLSIHATDSGTEATPQAPPVSP